jgi:hypothetical protein
MEISYTYPYRRNDGNAFTAAKIAMTDIDNLKVKFLKGISSGGPACPILGGDPNELLAVGHFKCLHAFVYPAIVAALLYKSSDPFRKYVAANIRSDSSGLVSMSPAEMSVFLEFVAYLTDEVNIFRYTYSVIQSQEPYNPRFVNDDLNNIPGAYKNLPVLHHDQMYSTYLFKLRKDNFKLLTLSPQFYIDNSPTDCTPSVLQFASTIASDGVAYYYIPYGENDSRGRILMIEKDDLHNFLKEEAYLGDVKASDDHAYYFGVMKQFFKIHIFKKPSTP